MGTFRLDPAPAPSASVSGTGGDGLGGAALLQDAQWFTRVRWAVIVVLAAFGSVTAFLPTPLRHIGIAPPHAWPLVLAAVLTLINILVMVSLRGLSAATPRRTVAVNIWVQILADLLVLAAMVHLVGSTRTVIAFAYLFHIALACIFFGRRESFMVTLLSAGIFLSVIVLECAGILGRSSIFAFASTSPIDPVHALVFAIPTVFVWFVVWYLVSTISAALRQRDRDLDEANKRLLRADAEKNIQMLRVTHDLKAPFVGIESNIETLRSSHWNDIPAEARQIIEKIEARGATLRARIGDILTLGDLRSTMPAAAAVEPIDLKALTEGIIRDTQGLATQKRVTVVLTAAEGSVRSDPKQLKALLSNLVANAVSYSHDGGTVSIDVRLDGQPRIRVSDQGIGITPEALPHVFDDFYRSKEAARFNPQATGLGLAIVRQAAQNLGIRVTVESEPGKGTSFEVVLPDERTPPSG